MKGPNYAGSWLAILILDQTSDLRMRNGNGWLPHPQIQGTCSRIQQEADNIIYGTATFMFMRMEVLMVFLVEIGQGNSTMIERVYLLGAVATVPAVIAAPQADNRWRYVEPQRNTQSRTYCTICGQGAAGIHPYLWRQVF